MIQATAPLRLSPEEPPILLAVIDTEEEFDWSKPPDRAATKVTAMRHIHRVQKIFEEYRIVPCYVVDYPVATQETGYRPLKEFLDAERAVIGAQLHPWVNPPHEEELCARNTYAGNLPRNLEAAKLDALAQVIQENFDLRPVIYKAGRYGVGANSTAILEELGFEVDLSVCPPMDFSADGGPDFSRAPCEPYRFGTGQRLLEIPMTGAYTGCARRSAHALYKLATSPLAARLRVAGILSRLGILDRLVLSPEGFTTREHLALTRALLDRGVRTFTWSFHSSSLLPGGSPYVRSDSDVNELLTSFRRYFDYFFGDLGGRTMTPLELKHYLETVHESSGNIAAR